MFAIDVIGVLVHDQLIPDTRVDEFRLRTRPDSDMSEVSGDQLVGQPKWRLFQQNVQGLQLCLDVP